MDVREVILEQIRQVAAEQGKKLAPLTDETLLLESGLDSLCVAILVANLEDQLGIDPFSMGDDAVLPVTIGEFIEVYQNAVVAG
jgi:aryl carrier-like protein